MTSGVTEVPGGFDMPAAKAAGGGAAAVASKAVRGAGAGRRNHRPVFHCRVSAGRGTSPGAARLICSRMSI